ncbi:MAG: hypothetical protein Q8M09_16585 [Pseudomonadota bacterium]|nr:hypothetical protein [Pseudomonadota bacterium]MDP1905835.1 hypothetical protein [Pseudomonadota bacterium]
MKPWLLPSGRQRGIAFLLPDDWSPEQAQAVLELLDDLREVIWQHYLIPVQELLADERDTDLASDSWNSNEDDTPF